MKTKMAKSSIVFFIASAFVTVVGTALIINNVLLYNDNVTMYVSQGYSVQTVSAQLLPSQLIPGVLEPLGMMYGIAFVLAAAGIINNKISKVLALSATTSEIIVPESEVEETVVETASDDVEETAKTEDEVTPV
ncbi:MAG TPA: hypothetical protein VIK34_02605 [Clostridiaceae bacterium]